MNVPAIKTMLKAIVLTQLMHSVAEQGRTPTAEETAAVKAVNDELLALGNNPVIDMTIDEAFPGLLAAIDGLEVAL